MNKKVPFEKKKKGKKSPARLSPGKRVNGQGGGGAEGKGKKKKRGPVLVGNVRDAGGGKRAEKETLHGSHSKKVPPKGCKKKKRSRERE